MFAHLSDAELGRRLAARTLALVDRASASGEEAPLAAALHAELRGAGTPVRDAGDTCLVLGDPVPGAVVLAGHLDTVPPQGNLPGRLADGAVHGLGACDMKGSVAVILEAMLAGAPAVGVLFGREELPVARSALTPLLGREPGLREAGLAVVMEPTAGTLQAGCLGNLNATWTFTGVAAHAARPWLGDNAIERAAVGVARLAAAAPPREVVDQGLAFSEVVQVTRIAGGIADNVIPDRVEAHVNARYAPGTRAQDAEAWLTGLCSGEGEVLEITSNAPSAPVALDEPLVARLIAAGALTVAPKQAWTPVAEFARAGVPAVNFGPGDPAVAHRRDERVEVAALVRSARVLERFLCG